MPGPEPTPTEGDGQGDRLPDDVVADLVADERCRRVLACLADADDPLPVEDVARRVLAGERDVDPQAVDEATVRETREALFRDQIPRLTATSLVTYDSMLGTLELATVDERLLSAVA